MNLLELMGSTNVCRGAERPGSLGSFHSIVKISWDQFKLSEVQPQLGLS